MKSFIIFGVLIAIASCVNVTNPSSDSNVLQNCGANNQTLAELLILRDKALLHYYNFGNEELHLDSLKRKAAAIEKVYNAYQLAIQESYNAIIYYRPLPDYKKLLGSAFQDRLQDSFNNNYSLEEELRKEHEANPTLKELAALEIKMKAEKESKKVAESKAKAEWKALREIVDCVEEGLKKD